MTSLFNKNHLGYKMSMVVSSVEGMNREDKEKNPILMLAYDIIKEVSARNQDYITKHHTFGFNQEMRNHLAKMVIRDPINQLSAYLASEDPHGEREYKDMLELWLHEQGLEIIAK